LIALSLVNQTLARRTLRKVPEVTVYFWIIKLLTTAMGESTSDFLVFQIDPYVAVVLGCGVSRSRCSCSSTFVATSLGSTG
jgi:uncharacterized membrane-anchored protein